MDGSGTDTEVCQRSLGAAQEIGPSVSVARLPVRGCHPEQSEASASNPRGFFIAAFLKQAEREISRISGI
jgi:hypothetical protein